MFRKQVWAATLCGLTFGSPALADDLYCDGVYGAESFEFVKVPPGADCVLEGTRVDGNVQVEVDGSLVVWAARIGGNIQSDGAAFIQILEDTFVGGNVEIDKTSGAPALGIPNLVCGTRIDGNLKLVANRGPFRIGDGACRAGNQIGGSIQIDDNVFAGPFLAPFAVSVAHNVIGGNVQLSDNRSRLGDLNVFRNRIFENLQCVDNDPAPVGGENIVYGVAQEQCAALAAGRLGDEVSTPVPGPVVEKKQAKKLKVKKAKKPKVKKAKKR